MDNVEEKVISIIAEQLARPKSEVTLASSLEEDLGADSLDKVEMSMSIEDAFENLVIPDDEFENIETVRDLVDYIEEHSK